MSTLLVTINQAHSAVAPRGALWAAAAVAALTRAIDRWLAPRAAVIKASANDVMRVRALARSYQQSDPGFASDLQAAADRHELGDSAR